MLKTKQQNKQKQNKKKKKKKKGEREGEREEEKESRLNELNKEQKAPKRSKSIHNIISIIRRMVEPFQCNAKANQTDNGTPSMNCKKKKKKKAHVSIPNIQSPREPYASQ